MLRNFDTANTGIIPKEMFLQIMKTKEVPEQDVQDMLDGRVAGLFSLFVLLLFSTKISLIISVYFLIFSTTHCHSHSL